MPGQNGRYRSVKVSAAAKRRAVGSALSQQHKSVRITPGQRAAIVRSTKKR
jgi:hypothetical protein